MVGEAATRGADVNDSRIHSIRLPGYTIGLEARFGLADERLTISYDGGPRAGPYVADTLLAIRRVSDLRRCSAPWTLCSDGVTRRETRALRRTRCRRDHILTHDQDYTRGWQRRGPTA
jgi:hypothetical protein